MAAKRIAPKIFPARLLKPEVCCPSCGTPVSGFAGTAPLRLGDNVKTREDSQVGTPAHRLYATYDWVTFPCYCRVHPFWAMKFFEEMGRRDRGLAAKSVDDLTLEDRQTLADKLHEEIDELYDRREAAITAGMNEQRARVERDLLLKVQDLSILVPESHKALPPVLLDSEVVKWAQSQGMAIPPVSDKAIREAQEELTPDNLLSTITSSPEYDTMNLASAQAFADRIHEDFMSFLENSVPMPVDAIQLISKIVPEAKDFLQAQMVEGIPQDAHPLEVMMMGKRRRVTRNESDDEDTDDED